MKNEHVVLTRRSALFAWTWNCGSSASSSLPSSEVSWCFDRGCCCESQHHSPPPPPPCNLQESMFLWWPSTQYPFHSVLHQRKHWVCSAFSGCPILLESPTTNWLCFPEGKNYTSSFEEHFFQFHDVNTRRYNHSPLGPGELRYIKMLQHTVAPQ